MARAGGRCEQTGIPSDHATVPGIRYRVNWMSIDRLSNSSGYSLFNARLVRAALNIDRGRITLDGGERGASVDPGEGGEAGGLAVLMRR